MTTFFASISVLMGALMLLSKSRDRFPCFGGGWCAILAGGFMLGLPFLNSIRFLGLIWFCVWLAALPSLVACVVALSVLALQAKATVYSVVLGMIAILANVPPALSFWSAAATGVVDTNHKIESGQNGFMQRVTDLLKA
jgi:hypothetical protein